MRSEPGYMTVNQLARHLGVSSRTVERWWAQGLLPEPVKRSNGTKLWSGGQARNILTWYLTVQRKEVKGQVKR